uniref:Uncharacterized protein n=1 Tax=Cacopsylla melanoneura TaxID=428564 RepID=A0A8D8TCS6_9HEMI
MIRIWTRFFHVSLSRLEENIEITDSWDIKTQCMEEVDRMNTQKIGDSNLTYCEFLRKRTYQLAVCLKNQSIMNTLEQGDHRTAYPMYDDVINGHFRDIIFHLSSTKLIPRHLFILTVFELQII